MSQSFIFDTIESDLGQGIFSFSYTLLLQETHHTFKEVIILPAPVTRKLPHDLLKNVLQMLHLVLGISYWKTYCPKNIIYQGYPLSPKQVLFWNTLYTQGLGEFYFKNSIDFRGLVSFPSQDSVKLSPVRLNQKKRSLLGLGGGKDSIVVATLLAKYQKPFDTFIVETQHAYGFMDAINTTMGKNPLIVQRKIDPNLIELNKNPTTYNGHIPISAVYAAIGILLAVAYDYSYVVVGNERSSDVGNTIFHGKEINHQWSKSHVFEKLFHAYVQDVISPDLHYLSVLRPLSEMQVMSIFVKYHEYLPLFSSCNRNFHISGTLIGSKWCTDCPKCLFVFSMLAAYIPKEQVVSLIGKNLLADQSLLPLFQQLWGERGIKPFECIGTPEETIYALAKAYNQGGYENDVIMDYFVNHILAKTNIRQLEQEVMNEKALSEMQKILQLL